MRVPDRVARGIAQLELGRPRPVDQLVAGLAPVAEAVGRGRRGEGLRGAWLGHALHPLLTDLPLGCWLSAGLLDLVGGARSRPAAQRLIGIGLALVPPTAAAGLADWAELREERTRRVGAVHAAGNAVVAGLYLASWRARRDRRHARGVALGLAGGTLAWGTGFLGGHLSFGRGAGVGARGLDDPSSLPSGATDAARGAPAEGRTDGA